MASDTTQLKSSLLRILTAVAILSAMYLISYILLGQRPESHFTPARNLNRVIFSVLLAGPLVLLWQSICDRRLEPGVILWGAYAGGCLMLVLVSIPTRLFFLSYLIVLLCSLPVFLYATILLGAEIRSRRFDVTTLVATIVTLLASGQILVDAALNPIVI
ncbi:hypothetical protein Mal35_30920 [Gimesia maris]|uniref:hypothetical protein n=1 Tax=Gimesia maris TaxID=122 RepID=UPI00118BD384|nr:hypothetical protein [Gimesia maris]QDT79628.1 hypothetical protein Mal35_30920 [Gimesia maris]